MEIQGLDYNTQREKLKLIAYGRNIQQMVDAALQLPTKAERQSAATAIVEAMRKVVPSHHNKKERMPVLWYHLALMSDFKLDIDYPVEFVHEDKMATPPNPVSYNKERMPPKHYGRLIFQLFDTLCTMPDGDDRKALIHLTANQMYRCLAMWGGNVDAEKIASDMARYTDGMIQVAPEELGLNVNTVTKTKKKKKK